jgi:hypothetical protein
VIGQDKAKLRPLTHPCSPNPPFQTGPLESRLILNARSVMSMMRASVSRPGGTTTKSASNKHSTTGHRCVFGAQRSAPRCIVPPSATHCPPAPAPRTGEMVTEKFRLGLCGDVRARKKTRNFPNSTVLCRAVNKAQCWTMTKGYHYQTGKLLTVACDSVCENLW